MNMKVTLSLTINEDTYDNYKDVGYSDSEILLKIKRDINGAKIESRLIHDFEVENITSEVKA